MHTAQQFRFAYRAACLNNLKYTIAGTNCTNDDANEEESAQQDVDKDELFASLIRIHQDTRVPLVITRRSALENLAGLCARAPQLQAVNNIENGYSGSGTSKSLSVMEEQTLFYMAGFLGKKALRNIDCCRMCQILP